MGTNKAYDLAGDISSKRIEFTQGNGDSGVYALSTGARKLDQLIIDNTAGTSDVYLKFYDLASGSVTIGGDHPPFIFPCPAGESVEYSIQPYVTFATAVSAHISREPGTGDTSPLYPTWDVKTYLLLHT